MKKRAPVLITAAVIAVLALALYFANEYINGFGFFTSDSGGVMAFVTTGVNIEYEQKSGAAFYSFQAGKGFYFATKDGIRYMSDGGRTLMAESYTMQNPLLYGEGQIVGVVEFSGYEAYVFNTQGLMYPMSFTNPIVNFAINSMGYACVVTKKDDEYESFVYNDNGALIQRRLDAGSIIIATDISNDGRIWAISYLDISGAQYNSRLTFAYLNRSEAAGYNDSIFASLLGDNNPLLNNQYFGIIRFMDGNNLVVASEGGIFCIDPAAPSKPKWIVESNNELDCLYFTESHIAIAMGKPLLNKPAEPAGRVALLNLSGTRVFEYESGDKVTSLYCSSLGLIIGCGRSFTALNLKGSVIWDYSAVFDSRAMLFLDSADKVILQTGRDASVLKLTKITGAPTPVSEQE